MKAEESLAEIKREVQLARERHLLALHLEKPSRQKLMSDLAHAHAIAEVQNRMIERLSAVHGKESSLNSVALEMLKVLAPDIRRGKKVKASARLGHESVYGSDEKKLRDKAETVKLCAEIAVKNPRWGIESVSEGVAEQMGFKKRTIRRRVPNLRQVIADARAKKT